MSQLIQTCQIRKMLFSQIDQLLEIALLAMFTDCIGGSQYEKYKDFINVIVAA